MDTFTSVRDELVQINQDMQSLFATAKTIPGMSEDSFGDWEKACTRLRRQLGEDIIRVAVVGPIKSGKSTFLNSMLRGDFLKRGAGAVTSIVTRIRAGTHLEAKLFFKSWEEVNADMEQALALFPSLDKHSEDTTFDIRRELERQKLWDALKSLGSEYLITRDTRNINIVLLSSYLKGYDTVCDIIATDTTQHYTNDRFVVHKDFVGNETLAVYLRDVELEIDSPDLEANLELADCQGSDSSNPLHLAMIQDYLLLTNLIIYVISSRTGLRRADIRFLSMIKKIGILGNTLFVINCDFSEHESIDDLNTLIKKVHEELSMIKPKPEIYTFSALFNLFRFIASNLSKKDRVRLYQWEADRDLAAFSERQTARFESAFKEKLTRRRKSLLLNNHLERLSVILSGMDNWLGINQKILTRDSQSAQEIIKKLDGHHRRLRQIKSLINTTITGAVTKLKHKSSADVNRFFEMHSGYIIGSLVKFIQNYKKMPHISKKKIDLPIYSKTIYSAFQGFKQSLDAFITEDINPEVIRFIKQKEKEIQKNIDKLIQPYDVMLNDAYNEYHRLMERFGVSANVEGRPGIQLPDMEALIQHAGLSPPKIAATMRYSASIKTAAIVHFGFYNLQRKFKKLLRKPVKERSEVVHRALQGGAQQMKRETLKSVLANFKDYRENLKFGYFSKLIEATASGLAEILVERFQIYFNDLSTIVGQINHTKMDKEQALKILKEMEVKSNQLKKRVDRLREKIEDVG
ncbi:MAG: dynamin family protein [Desulfobacterales bacterium]|nr:MAG: dynamin family protein [Desulfobacterales bacterium]